ncbi:MAG: hypothetical protein AAF580_00810 [Pseudomonadota bacterium]
MTAMPSTMLVAATVPTVMAIAAATVVVVVRVAAQTLPMTMLRHLQVGAARLLCRLLDQKFGSSGRHHRPSGRLNCGNAGLYAQKERTK